jgi:hypothetical protein
MINEELAKRAAPQEEVEGEGEGRTSTSGVTAHEERAPDIVIGVREGAVNQEAIGRIHAANPNVTIVEIIAEEQSAMLEELEGARILKGARSSALIDVEGISSGEVEATVRGLAQRLASDRFDLTFPKLRVLNEQAVEELRVMTERDLQRVQQLLVGGIPVIENYELNEKSVFDLRIHHIYSLHRKDYSRTTKAYLNALAEDSANKRHYVATTVTNAFEMRLLAEAIKERKEVMEVARGRKDPIEDVVFVKMDNVRDENLDELLAVTGLAGQVRRDNCVIIPSGLTPQEAFDVIRGLYAARGIAVTPKEVALGATKDTVIADRANPDAILKQMLLVQLGKEGLTSQLYKMVIDIMASRDNMPEGVSAKDLEAVSGYKWYIYLPKIEAINIAEEAKAYERYVQDVLTRA